MNRPLKLVLTAVSVLVFGAARLPLEHHLGEKRRAQGLREDADLELKLSEQITQASLFAVLGGLRSLAACIWDLWAYKSWEQDPPNYAQVEKDYRLCQRLQPRMFYYWDRGQWMMAYNASSYYRLSAKESRGINEIRAQSFIEKGLQMVKESQLYLPKEPKVYEMEARLYWQKIRPRQPLKEAEAWQKAASLPGALPYYIRNVAYCLAMVPGREAEAEALLRQLVEEDPRHQVPTVRTLLHTYELVRRLEADPSLREEIYRELIAIYDRLPAGGGLPAPAGRSITLICTLKQLEEQLNIPASERIPETGDTVEAPEEEEEDE